MGALGALSGVGNLIGGAGALGGAFQQAGAAEAAGEAQQQMFETNARLSEMNATDSIARGEKAAQGIRKQAKGMIGAQRAALAAQGIEVNSDTALALQEETAAMSAEDAMTVRNNAWREAWGFRVQANDLRGQGIMAKMGAKNKAANTLVVGGLSAAESLTKASGTFLSGVNFDRGREDRGGGGSSSPLAGVRPFESLNSTNTGGGGTRGGRFT